MLPLAISSLPELIYISLISPSYHRHHHSLQQDCGVPITYCSFYPLFPAANNPPILIFIYCFSSLLPSYSSGTLAGTDTRWDVISQSVDDRTDRERGEEEKLDEWESVNENENENENESGNSIAQEVDPELVAGGVKRLFKSRYSSVSRFIGKTESEEEQKNIDALNDLDANMDEEAFQILLDGGLDRSLASHIAHLFVRDPLVIFDDAIDLDNETAMVSQPSAVHHFTASVILISQSLPTYLSHCSWLHKIL